MAGKRAIRNRLGLGARGDGATATLEAYRRAGVAVYELLGRADELRLELELEGSDAWSASPARQVEFLCAWNAYALQTIGDHLLDAYQTAGSAPRAPMPPEVVRQALAFYHGVEGWLSVSSQARSNPAYRLDGPLPASLPVWRGARHASPLYLEGLLGAMNALRSRAEAELAAFACAARPEEVGLLARQKESATRQMRQLLAEASAKAEYVSRLCAGETPADLRDRAARHSHDAIGILWRLGQLLAMPQLVDLAPPRPPASPSAPAWITPTAPESSFPGGYPRVHRPGSVANEYAYGIGARYAGFWDRLRAFLLDLLLFVVCATLALQDYDMSIAESVVSWFLLWWFYVAGMECSPLQATVGKFVFGLKVTGLHGERLTFERAAGRRFAELLSLLLCFAGYLLAVITRRRQALHDVLAGTVVIDTKPESARELGTGPEPELEGGW